MSKNKSKDSHMISRPLNSQKIKNLIHLKDLKKLKNSNSNKKNKNTEKNNFNNYISSQRKKIFKKLANKYNRNPEYYYKKIITDILDNEYSHIVAVFKEYLIFGDYSEFLQDYFKLKEIYKFLPLISEYYHSSTVIFPNYVNLEEKKYIYNNIQKKQKIINFQQQQEEEEQKKRNKNKSKRKNKNKDINADEDNYFSDSTSKSDVITTHALNSILNQTNTSNNRQLFGITNKNNNNNSQDLLDFIKKIGNIEQKINIKNKNLKKRSKHIIAIHKGKNSLKKENNKSNNTNTWNTISTKNNTKGKEKSNLDARSFSDKNIKKKYNLSSINLNNNNNINKYFLLKLGQIKERNGIKTTKNNMSKFSSLNCSEKINKLNCYNKQNNQKQLSTIFNNKAKNINTKAKKFIFNNTEKETIIKNKISNYKNIKRIKSYYGLNINNFNHNSRNKNINIFCESTIFSNHYIKIPAKNCTTYKISSILNNIHNDKKMLSIDFENKNKKADPKKKRCVLDSQKIINVIYTNRGPSNISSSTLKNSKNNSKKLISYKTKNNSKIINIPLEKKKIKFSISPIGTKKTININPFKTKITPLYTMKNENKRIIKMAFLSPKNISSKLSPSKLLKKNLNKKIVLNQNKVKIKKDISGKIKDNKSNIINKRKIFGESGQIYFRGGGEFLTINIDQKSNRSLNFIDMKKNFVENNKSIINSIKSNKNKNHQHYRTKILSNKIQGVFAKYKKE